jgi:hypothetical protein
MPDRNRHCPDLDASDQNKNQRDHQCGGDGAKVEYDLINLQTAGQTFVGVCVPAFPVSMSQWTSASEISPIRTLMKKIQCQEKLSVIQPPSVGRRRLAACGRQCLAGVGQ